MKLVQSLINIDIEYSYLKSSFLYQILYFLQIYAIIIVNVNIYSLIHLRR